MDGPVNGIPGLVAGGRRPDLVALEEAAEEGPVRVVKLLVICTKSHNHIVMY